MDKQEEEFYAIAAAEISDKNINTALMAKALSEADGDKNKTLARYIKLRVRQLQEQHAANVDLQRSKEKEQADFKRATVERDEIIKNGGRVPHTGFSIFLELVLFFCILWVVMSVVGHYLAFSRGDYRVFRGIPEFLGGAIGLVLPWWIARRIWRYLKKTVYRSKEMAAEILEKAKNAV